MSSGNTKKLKLNKQFENLDIEGKSIEENIKNVALVYKNKNHRVQKELTFESKMNNSKLT
tara:strand:- start:45647 stop:45826 length:180 start_codon:yes stop_codon:yes gene_type:complete